MAVSIADVASRAKVSISTVSRVVNGNPVVNSETRKRVEKAILELGYRPNVFARGLMLNKSKILSLVLPDLHGQFYSEVIRGANLRARELGYQLLLSSVTKDDDEQVVISSIRSNSLADGVAVMITDMTSTIKDSLDHVKVPIVVIDGDPAGSKHDSVVIDHYVGARAIMKHLLSSSEIQRIIFVGGPATNIDSKERYKAYRDSLQMAGMEPNSRDIYHLDFQFDTAYQLATENLNDWVGPQTCVFAANDEMAAGIIQAAHAKRIPIPDELRVVGFDDIRISQLMQPRLTTVRVPLSEMGAAAVELLCQRLESPDRPSTRITLQSELVVRDSCGVTPAKSTKSRPNSPPQAG